MKKTISVLWWWCLCWLVADLGKKMKIGRSELCFVRPTEGHAYVLEGSIDGLHWEPCGGHSDVQRKSPHVDEVAKASLLLRKDLPLVAR